MEVREPVAKYLARPAFKQTEVGLIPEDWAVSPLEQLCSMKSGQGITSSAIEEAGKHPCYGGNGLRGYTNKFTHEGNYALIGRQGALCGNVIGAVGQFYASEHAIVVTPRSSVDIDWLTFVLRDMNLNQYSESSAQPGLSVSKLLCLPVATPTKKIEQQAIAEALTDADALIEALEQLLAKKRQIKQGAMQELLTGQKRLPGFGGEWEHKPVGDFTDCTAGGTPSTQVPKYWGGPIRWMSSGELNLKAVDEVEGRITEDGLRNSSTKLIPANCVLVGLAGQGKTRGTVAMNLIPLCTNQSIAAIFPNESFIPSYLYYNLDSRYDELRELSAGDGGRGGLNLTIIRSLVIPFPSLAEQTAIAAVLSDMDAEIAAHEAKLAKARAVKQGMMQELLTGRIRLV